MSTPTTTTSAAPEPPHNREAEEATIGSVLINPEAGPSLQLFLKPGDFYISRHRMIWEALKRLQVQRIPVDLVTLSEELDRVGELAEIGGPAYLTALSNSAPQSQNAEAYGRIVESHAIRRRMITSAQAIARAAYEEGHEITDSLATAEKAFNSIMLSQANDRAHITETLSQQYDEIDQHIEPRVTRTGYAEIDKMLGGGYTGDGFYIIAGRPGEGKTSSLLANAYYAAMGEEALGIPKQKVLFASLEMNRHEVTNRLVSFESGINTQRIKNRKMLEHEWPIYTHSIEVLSNLDIVFDDRPLQTPDHLRLTALHERPDVIFVDYIQLMNSGLDPRTTRNDQIGHISRSLKLLARELHIPVIAASQLSRDVEKRRNKEPHLSDLRESGSLEQDADVVMFIWRNATKVTTEIEPVHMKTAKQRNGPVGMIEGLSYRPECARLEENSGQYSLPMIPGGA
jgi:replicative DNA helicase